MAFTYTGSAATVLPAPTFKARRKAALDKVVARVNASELQPSLFGPFSIAPDRNLWSSLHNPQIRSLGGRKLGDVEFRTFLGLGNAGPKRQLRMVDSVLQCARDFVRFADLGRLDGPLQAARELARRIPGDAVSNSGALQVAAMGLRPDRYTGNVYLTVDIQMLGDDLQPGIECVSGLHGEMSDLETKVDRKVARHAELERRRGRLAAAGASCWIDEIALRIADQAGLAIADVIDLLTDRSELELCYDRPGGRPIRCSIKWAGGVLRGSVGSPYDPWMCSRELLSIKSVDLPDTLTRALVGGQLKALVGHPLLPGEAIITGWHGYSGGASIPLRVGKVLVLAGGVARRADGAVDWVIEAERPDTLAT